MSDLKRIIEYTNVAYEPLEQWINEFLTDEVKNKKEFIADIQRCFLNYHADQDIYTKRKRALENHKKRDYMDEIRQCYEASNFISDCFISNPLINKRDDAEAREAFERQIKVQRFLSKSLLKLLGEMSENLNAIETVSKCLFKKAGKAETQVEAIEYLELSNIILGGADIFINKHNAYSSKKTSKEIKIDFIKKLATKYLSHTNRKSLNRTSLEISKKEKSPFNMLVRICYNCLHISDGDKARERQIAEMKKLYYPTAPE